MERYNQFRDRGSGVTPFLPIRTPNSIVWSLVHAGLFCIRLPIFLGYATVYFLFLHYLPLPVAVRKGLLWMLMFIPGIWWVDFRVDGVRRGQVPQQPPERMPHAGSIIAANYTSPLDALYLAVIFDPIFTISYPDTRAVQPVSLLFAILHALFALKLSPPPDAPLTDLATLLRNNPDRAIAVFPECTTTNGKGVLPLSPSLLAAPPGTYIFPLSVRYTPADVTTPIPGRWARFLYDLLSHVRICMRVRIAERMTVGGAVHADSDMTNGVKPATDAPPTQDEQRVLDKVAEALARLGRSSRVGLTVKDKAVFVEAWRGGKAKSS